MAMFQNKAKTVAEYLKGLPDDRRKELSTVRRTIKKHLPPGYKEEVNWGAITYAVPLSRFPNTYNGQPLCYVALASQKNHLSLYLMTVYGNSKNEAELKDAFAKAGKKLDMGKACIRFKTADDLPLETVGKLIARTPPDVYIQMYESSRRKTAR